MHSSPLLTSSFHHSSTPPLLHFSPPPFHHSSTPPLLPSYPLPLLHSSTLLLFHSYNFSTPPPPLLRSFTPLVFNSSTPLLHSSPPPLLNSSFTPFLPSATHPLLPSSTPPLLHSWSPPPLLPSSPPPLSLLSFFPPPVLHSSTPLFLHSSPPPFLQSSPCIPPSSPPPVLPSSTHHFTHSSTFHFDACMPYFPIMSRPEHAWLLNKFKTSWIINVSVWILLQPVYIMSLELVDCGHVSKLHPLFVRFVVAMWGCLIDRLTDVSIHHPPARFSEHAILDIYFFVGSVAMVFIQMNVWRRQTSRWRRWISEGWFTYICCNVVFKLTLCSATSTMKYEVQFERNFNS